MRKYRPLFCAVFGALLAQLAAEKEAAAGGLLVVVGLAVSGAVEAGQDLPLVVLVYILRRLALSLSIASKIVKSTLYGAI